MSGDGCFMSLSLREVDEYGTVSTMEILGGGGVDFLCSPLLSFLDLERGEDLRRRLEEFDRLRRRSCRDLELDLGLDFDLSLSFRDLELDFCLDFDRTCRDLEVDFRLDLERSLLLSDL